MNSIISTPEEAAVLRAEDIECVKKTQLILEEALRQSPLGISQKLDEHSLGYWALHPVRQQALLEPFIASGWSARVDVDWHKSRVVSTRVEILRPDHPVLQARREEEQRRLAYNDGFVPLSWKHVMMLGLLGVLIVVVVTQGVF